MSFSKKKSERSPESFIKPIDKTLNLNCVAGQDETIRKLRNILVSIKYQPVFKRWAANSLKGLMFYGEPGTGKTYAAECFAAEADAIFFELKQEDFASEFVDKPILLLSNIKKCVNTLAINDYVIVFIDEIDSFLRTRGKTSHNHDDKKVNFWLSWLSGIGMDKNIYDHIIFIGTTNRLDMIDPGMLRSGRFEEHLEFTRLEGEDALRCLKIQVDQYQPIEAGHLLFQLEIDDSSQLKSYLNDMTGADVNRLVRQALCAKALENVDKIKGPLENFMESNPEYTDEISVILCMKRNPGIVAPITVTDLINEAKLLVEENKQPSKIGF